LTSTTSTELLGVFSAIYLLAKAPGSQAAATTAQQRDYRRHSTPVHLDLVVDNLDAALARAQRAGAVVEGEVRSHSCGRIAQLAEPFGHGFWLIQFQGRGYGVTWRGIG
jgi:predicted enzyme related to lactoylglutathione lyase